MKDANDTREFLHRYNILYLNCLWAMMSKISPKKVLQKE